MRTIRSVVDISTGISLGEVPVILAVMTWAPSSTVISIGLSKSLLSTDLEPVFTSYTVVE